MKIDRRGLIAVAGSSWLVSLAGLATSVIRGKVSAIQLGPEGVGLVGQLNALSILGGSVAILGMGTAAVQLIGKYRGRGDQQSLEKVARFVVAGPLLVSLLVAVAACVISPYLSIVLFADSGRWLEVCVTLLSIPLNVLVGCAVLVLQARGDALSAATSSIISLPINTIIVIVMVVNLQLPGAVASIFITSLIPAIVMAAREPDLFRITRKHLGLPSSLRKQMLTLGLASFFLGGLSALMDSAIRSSLTRTGGLSISGQYQVLSMASNQAFLQVCSGVLVFLGPSLAATVVSGRAQARDDLRKAWMLLFALIIIGGVVTCTFTELLLRTFFSDEFLPAGGALRLQMAGEVLRAGAFLLGAVFLPLGLRRLWLTTGILTLAVQLSVFVLLVSKIGLLAAPVAFIAAWLLNLTVSFVVAGQRGLLPSSPTLALTIVGSIGVAVLASSVTRGSPTWIGAVFLATISAFSLFLNFVHVSKKPADGSANAII